MDDIASALTLEIKRDIATRYFGFRKWFEEESSEYTALLDSTTATQERHLQHAAEALETIRILLGSAEIYTAFLKLSGSDENEATMNDRPIKVRTEAVTTAALDALKKGLRFGRRKRHGRLIFAAYQGYQQTLDQDHELQQELLDRHTHLADESKRFYRNNDIASILDFIRGLDSMDSPYKGLQAGPAPGHGAKLAGELHLPIPPSPSTKILILKKPRPLAEIKQELKVLASKGYSCLQI